MNNEHFVKETEHRMINASVSILFIMLIALLVSYVAVDMKKKEINDVVEPTRIIKVDCGLYDADIDKHDYMCYKIEVILNDYYKENMK